MRKELGWFGKSGEWSGIKRYASQSRRSAIIIPKPKKLGCGQRTASDHGFFGDEQASSGIVEADGDVHHQHAQVCKSKALPVALQDLNVRL